MSYTSMISTAAAIHLFKKSRAWFGPAVLMFKGQVIDGRTRQAAITLLPPVTRSLIHAPVVTVKSRSHAACLLAVNEHADRAVEYLSPFAETLKDIADEIWLPAAACKLLYDARRKMQKPKRTRNTKAPHHARKLAGLAALLESQETITRDEIERCVEDYRMWRPKKLILGAKISPTMLDELMLCVAEMRQGHPNLSSIIRAALTDHLQDDFVDMQWDTDTTPKVKVSVLVGTDLAEKVHGRAKALHVTVSRVLDWCLQSWVGANCL